MGKLQNIQHLRGLAALLVLLSHASNAAARIDPASLLGRFPDAGHFGVDVFFVISGFIMYHTTRGQFGHADSAGRFMVKRLIRIVPLYWSVMLTYVALRTITGEAFDGMGLLKSLAFIPYRGEAGLFRPELGVGWSLNFEMLFYATFAIGLFFRLGLALICAILGALIVAAAIHPVGPLTFWGSPIVLEFLIGAGIGWVFARWRRHFVFPPLPIVLALFGAATACLWFVPEQYELGWRVVYWALAACIVVTALWGREADERPVSRALSFLGDASYSLYLVHPLFLAGVGTLLPRVTSNGWVAFSLIIAASLVAAATTHLFFEKPVTAWLQSSTRLRSARRPLGPVVEPQPTDS